MDEARIIEIVSSMIQNIEIPAPYLEAYFYDNFFNHKNWEIVEDGNSMVTFGRE